ncbi:MAG: adenylate/guanylate cyclase domain-containing protein [Bacteroidia bacterium]|nr:adenylate/guanylate cyclase domain-containing protein [Bacteroidia bacterium]
MSADHKLAVILFADIEGYTAMMQQNEETALNVMNRFKLVLEAETVQAKGQVVQYFGDGALLTFESAASAVTCAMAMQSAFQAEPFVPVRIGIHLGDVVYKAGNIFGDGVNVASRIESLGVPGAVLMSKSIQNQLKNKTGFLTQSLGRFEFKNVQEALEVFALSNEGFVVPRRGEMKGKLKHKKFSLLKQSWIIATVIAFLGILSWNFGPHAFNSTSNTSEDEINPKQKSIAVLPFRNLSEDSSQVYFSDGMAEEVLNALTQLKGLKVSARTSSFQFRGDEVDLTEVGEKLGVKNVLEGSVQKSGNRLRIHVRLIDIENESQIWSDRFDKRLEDIFLIQDEIAQAIVGQLELRFNFSENLQLVKPPTDDKEAHDLYLRGLHYSNLAYFPQAIEQFENAILLDSTFAAAYAQLSMAKFRLYQPVARVLDHELAAEVRKLAEKALELDSTLDQAFEAMTFVYHDFDNDYQKAEKLLRKALELNPSSSSLYYRLFFNSLFQGSSTDSALMYCQKNLDLDPLNAMAHIQLGLYYFYSEDTLSSQKILIELESLFPRDPLAIWCSALISFRMGDYEHALKKYEPLLPIIKSIKSTQYYMHYLQFLAKVDSVSARKKLLEFQHDASWSASPYAFAIIYKSLGETDKVFEHLEEAIQSQDFASLRYIRFDPFWHDLRGNPRFQKYLHQLNMHLPSFDGQDWGIPYLEVSN